MRKSTFVEIPAEEHAQMLAALRRARYGYLLALHILLLCAAKRTPTDIAAVLFCSRSSVYRTVQAYKYRSPEGNTWTGKGRVPQWLQALEAQGRSREEFLVRQEGE
jgi:hypothetical protein